ncbi:unnamed protein product [Ectocarpus sp. CCAP 1310/34]|nr:unnamed protein product [Ectocarpus sp. CCAP 1310/34]
MLTEIERAPLPIVHYGIDLWQCKITGLKYIDGHVCYVNSNFELQYALLSVKHYAPSAAVQVTDKASEILFIVFKSVLREFGVKISDLAGGTTDSGSDVKAMCVNFLLAQHKVSQEIERYHLLYITAEEGYERAAVERDFSGCANLLTRNRSRMDTYWVEMVMFLHANFEHIPGFKDIPMIAAKDIHTCLPPRFNRGDADLAAAEAAFDVIENTETGDVGL